MSSVNIVLLAAGSGANAQSYRPDRDENQWWGRRDALVRCVTSSLFFGASADLSLWIYFDEDGSQMEMKNESSAQLIFLPTERNVIQLWKDAAREPDHGISRGGVVCRLHAPKGQTKATERPSTKNKRSLLEHLQNSCSLEFLRRHHLNAKPEAVLRKMNKAKLMKIWDEWQRESKLAKNGEHANAFASPFKVFVERVLAEEAQRGVNTLACTLHESSDSELPVWNDLSFEQHRTTLFMFLGAVRDISREENDVLRRTCQERKVPLVRVRLGPVPEFTSKILTVVAHHHYHGRLVPSTCSLASSDLTASRPTKRRKLEVDRGTNGDALITVCLLDLQSEELDASLDSRNTGTWNLVRCTVNALWRSRMAGQRNEASSLTNALILVFRDKVVSIDSAIFVKRMADGHQAAPSEHQVLNALKAEVEASDYRVDGDKAVAMAAAKLVTRYTIPYRLAYALDWKHTGPLLSKNFFDGGPVKSTDPTACAVVDLRVLRKGSCAELCKAITKYLRKKNVAIVSASPIAPPHSLDPHGATISMLQHFSYQGLLSSVLHQSIT